MSEDQFSGKFKVKTLFDQSTQEADVVHVPGIAKQRGHCPDHLFNPHFLPTPDLWFGTPAANSIVRRGIAGCPSPFPRPLLTDTLLCLSVKERQTDNLFLTSLVSEVGGLINIFLSRPQLTMGSFSHGHTIAF